MTPRHQEATLIGVTRRNLRVRRHHMSVTRRCMSVARHHMGVTQRYKVLVAAVAITIHYAPGRNTKLFCVKGRRWKQALLQQNFGS